MMGSNDDPVFKAFHRYQEISLKIAIECDSLLEEQREVALFAAQLKVFLVDLRGLLSSAVITNSSCTIDTTAAMLSRITTGLAGIEMAVGSDSTYIETVPASNVASLLSRKTA